MLRRHWPSLSDTTCKPSGRVSSGMGGPPILGSSFPATAITESRSISASNRPEFREQVFLNFVPLLLGSFHGDLGVLADGVRERFQLLIQKTLFIGPPER